MKTFLDLGLWKFPVFSITPLYLSATSFPFTPSPQSPHENGGVGGGRAFSLGLDSQPGSAVLIFKTSLPSCSLLDFPHLSSLAPYTSERIGGGRASSRTELPSLSAHTSTFPLTPLLDSCVCVSVVSVVCKQRVSGRLAMCKWRDSDVSAACKRRVSIM